MPPTINVKTRSASISMTDDDKVRYVDACVRRSQLVQSVTSGAVCHVEQEQARAFGL